MERIAYAGRTPGSSAAPFKAGQTPGLSHLHWLIGRNSIVIPADVESFALDAGFLSLVLFEEIHRDAGTAEAVKGHGAESSSMNGTSTRQRRLFSTAP